MRSKRVLLVSHEMTYTGSPRSLFYLANVLLETGFYVEVWTKKDGPFKTNFVNAGIPVSVIDESIHLYHERIISFDIAILNTIFTSDFLYAFQPFIRTVLFVREGKDMPSIIHNNSINESNISTANEIWTVSEYSKEIIERLFKPKHIRVLHNYIPDVHFHALNFVNERTIHYIVSGTMEHRKGIDLAINAFLKMPDFIREKSILHLVGDIPIWSKDYWKSLSNIMSNRIIYHGLIKDDTSLLSLYKSMNVFIIPSRDEPCSLVALEGAMLGKAVLFSNNVGAKYLDIDGNAIFNSEEVDMLSRKMCEFSSRRVLLSQGMKMKRQYLKTSTKKVYIKELMMLLNI